MVAGMLHNNIERVSLDKQTAGVIANKYGGGLQIQKGYR